MRSFKLRGLVVLLGVSFLVGCENTITSGPPSPSSASSIQAPKADTDAQGKGPRRPGSKKKAASGAAPALPD